MTDEQALEKAISTVTRMLIQKKEIWTADEGVFKNFEIHKALGVSPLQFALVMCNLKMERVKTRFRHSDGIIDDAEIEDSLIDLASYAQLALGILYAEREASAKHCVASA
jgi:hypothetical protein